MATLTIEFGGLCMFVTREPNKPVEGLFVLMPDMTMDAEAHCPMMLVPTLAVGKAALYPLLGEVVDLSALAPILDPNPTPPTFDWALNVSTYAATPPATSTPVADCWFTDPPTGALAVRVRLPRAAVVNGVGEFADIAIDHKFSAHPKWRLQGQGRTQVVMNLQRYNHKTLQIGPAIVDVTRDVTIYMLNIRRCDLQRQLPRPHFPGQRLKHQDSYYSLLDPCPGGVTNGPRFWVITPPIKTDDSPCNNIGCPPEPTLVDFSPPEVTVEWIDTHDCTVGIGT